MSNEKLKPSEKISAILNKLPIGEAIDEYNEAGRKLHERIEQNEKELANHKNKLGKKE